MNLLAEIAAESEDTGIDMVAHLMKAKDISTNELGRQLLERYGYWENGVNTFYQRFRHNVIISGCGTAVVTILLFLLIYKWKKKEMKKQQNIFRQMEQTLIKFRENDFEVVLATDDDNEQERIKYQIDALGNHIKLLKEEARTEKEGTKELVSDLSHQLKTPVAALDACFSVLLRDNLSAEEQQEFRVRCRSALNGLESLLQSLLQISKMEVGLIQTSRQMLPLIETIITAVNCVYPYAEEKQIEFIFDYDTSLENYKIMQDRKWLSEALINVLDNAIKYSPVNSEIFIRLQKRAGFARIEIEDQGIGIPKQEYHKIFKRFFRGSAPEVKENTGSGIGLFLSRKIIEQHGGTITVSSDFERKGTLPGNSGSTFIIQLPDNA